MKIRSSGFLAQAQKDTRRAALTFPAICRLSNGEIIATWRSGSTKDSDDETIEMRRSEDGAASWGEIIHPFGSEQVCIDGVAGSLKLAYLTEISPGRITAAAMWVDRTSYPGQPLFNPDTEGCLPMAILFAESQDDGHSWSAWRKMDMPSEIGPPSLTNPLLKLADGTLICSIETNKPYLDKSKWMQHVVFFHSEDEGRNWKAPVTVGQDPTGRVFHWDQRVGVAPDSRIGTFIWTYDSETQTYLQIHRRISADGGYTWSTAQPLGFADQASVPAVLPDGKVVLPWVDRFDSQSIKARMAHDIAGDFEAGSEVVIYDHPAKTGQVTGDTGDQLADMGIWSFGLPHACALPDGSVLVFYYAGTSEAMDIRYCLLDVDE